MCYWCYWGWPKPIRDIYDDCEQRAGESAMLYGPGHVVWADENWGSAWSCLDYFDQWVRLWNYDRGKDRFTAEQLAVVRESLERLVAVPEEFKREPEGYDDENENPADYPPPASWKCEVR